MYNKQWYFHIISVIYNIHVLYMYHLILNRQRQKFKMLIYWTSIAHAAGTGKEGVTSVQVCEEFGHVITTVHSNPKNLIFVIISNSINKNSLYNKYNICTGV